MSVSVPSMRVTATTGVNKFVGATPSAVGSGFGVVANAPGGRTGPLCIQFYKKAQLLLAWSGNHGGSNKIYSSDASDVWTAIKTLQDVYNGTTQGVTCGLLACYPNNRAAIVGVYMSNVDSCMHGILSYDGVTWTDTALVLGFNTFEGRVLSQIVWKNVVYTSFSVTHKGHWSWDPATNTESNSTPAAMSDFQQCFCEDDNGNLFKLAGYTTTPGVWLWAWSGGSWQPVIALPNTGNSSPANSNYADGQPILFRPGNGKLYAIYLTYKDSTHFGWLCAEITITGPTSATVSDISATVLPSGFAFGASCTLARTAVWRCLVEFETDALNPTTHLWYATATSSAAWNYNSWDGPATPIGTTETGSGGDVSMTLPTDSNGGSEYIWSGVSDFDTVIETEASDSGGLDVFIRASGPLGTELKSWALFYGLNGGLPANQGTLSDPGVVATTIAAGSNGVNVSTFAGAGTLHALDTTGFDKSGGTVFVDTGSGQKTVTYTGISGNDFTGCTCASSGVMSTGGNIKSGLAPAPTLDVGNQQLNDVTCDGNTATPTTFKCKWRAQADGVALNSNVRYTGEILS